MTDSNRLVMVDADAHVLEPATLWLDYLEPEFRDRAIRIEVDEQGHEVLLFDNKPQEATRGLLGLLGGIGMDKQDLITPGKVSYADGSPPGSYDPHARLKVLDDEGIDVALLYPTLGIIWEEEVKDPQLAQAYTRAYNRWLVDFCSVDRKRLVPIAHISLLDPEGAVTEVLRAHKAGCAGVFISPDMPARGGRHFDDPVYSRFWETLQDLQLPVSFHVVVRQNPSYRDWLKGGGQFELFTFAFLALDVQAAFTLMLSQGMFERYPRLRCAVLETGGTWIAAWLDRLDHKWESNGTTPLKPSDYFYRQCVVSADPDETMTAAVVNHVGADYFIWASDYPHIDSSFNIAREMKQRVADLPLDAQRKVLGGNALRFYGLDY